MDNLHKLESELHNLIWHLKVAQESGGSPCPLVVENHAKLALLYFGRYEAFGLKGGI
tara:strand:+ start:587 stop:757 length:171 start_codon:yes stop_codon:yes gene_type:complete